MEFPRFRKKLKGILSSVERVVSTSKKIILSAGLLTVASGTGGAEPKVPADPRLSIQKSEITKALE